MKRKRAGEGVNLTGPLHPIRAVSATTPPARGCYPGGRLTSLPDKRFTSIMDDRAREQMAAAREAKREAKLQADIDRIDKQAEAEAAAAVADKPRAAAAVGHAGAAGPYGSAPVEPPFEADDDPHLLARIVLGAYPGQDRPTLIYWHGQFYEWTDRTHYEIIPDAVFDADLNRALRKVVVRLHDLRVNQYLEELKSNQEAIKPRLTKVTTGLVANVRAALAGQCLLKDVTEAPAWLDPVKALDCDPRHTVATQSGLVYLPDYLDRGRIGNLDSDFFNFNAVEYSVHPGNGDPPPAWAAFLNSLWPDDDESIQLLQEWMGYLLTADTSQQKMLLIVGPPRSGKGTIQRVISALVGHGNCCSPSLSALGGQFGMYGLLHKKVAQITDAEVTARTDKGAVTELLKKIVGEDAVDVDRKYHDIISGVKLTTRFIVTANRIPALFDASGALASRYCLLHITRSFLGEEDHQLNDRLMDELPGIFNWAVEGWDLLNFNGRFTEPASVAELRDHVRAITAPVSVFVDDCCVVDPTAREPTEDIYAEWKRWCERTGRKEPGTDAMLGEQLRALLPTIKRIRPRTREGRLYCYAGIRLRRAADDEAEYAEVIGQREGEL